MIKSYHCVSENSDETIDIDDEALFSMSPDVLQQKKPKCAVLNWLSKLIGVTASLSFNGKVNEDLGIACFFACMFAFCVCMFARM